MPLYDLACDACGHEEHDVVLPVSERNAAPCECGASMRPLIRPLMITGPMPSKPIVVGNGMMEIDSPSRLRAYQKAYPDRAIATESEWKETKWRVRQEAEGIAQRRGFRDLEDMRRQRREHGRERG